MGDAGLDRERAAEGWPAIDPRMSRRRQQHAGITDMAWAYLNDRAVDDHPEGYEYSLLESNQHDHSTGYRTQDIWKRFRDEVLADWIRRHPGTRPWCFWRFDSGLPRVYRPDHQRPFEIIEDMGGRDVTLWLVGRNSDNSRRLTDEEREGVKERFLLDQRTWLSEHNDLTESE